MACETGAMVAAAEPKTRDSTNGNYVIAPGVIVSGAQPRVSLFPVLLGPRLAIGCCTCPGNLTANHGIDLAGDILGLLVNFSPGVTPKYDSASFRE
jgi:hypothetical protein